MNTPRAAAPAAATLAQPITADAVSGPAIAALDLADEFDSESDEDCSIPTLSAAEFDSIQRAKSLGPSMWDQLFQQAKSLGQSMLTQLFQRARYLEDTKAARGKVKKLIEAHKTSISNLEEEDRFLNKADPLTVEWVTPSEAKKRWVEEQLLTEESAESLRKRLTDPREHYIKRALKSTGSKTYVNYKHSKLLIEMNT